MELPTFRYHPDPQATGAVIPSDARCVACGEARGTIYTGPVYAKEELVDCFCLWCIADGSAAAKFDAEFTDVGLAVPPGVADGVLAEVATRTPGFSGWQQEHWLYHCGDAAAFLGPVGWDELERHADALESLRQEHNEEYLMELNVEGDATAYLFRCLHCGRHLAYADAT